MKNAVALGLAAALLVAAGVGAAENGFDPVHTIPFGESTGMAVAGDLGIYGITNGIMVVDVSDPASPVRLSRLSLPGHVAAIVVDGSQAYVAAGEAGIAVVDLSDPNRPTLLEMLDTPGEAQDLVVSGSWLFVADDDGGLRSIDLSGGGVAGSVVPVPHARLVELGPQLALVAGSPDLWVIDVSDPGAMVAWSTIPVSAADVAIDATRAYVAAGIAGLVVFDLSYPASPLQMGEYSPGGYVRAVDDPDGLVWLTIDVNPSSGAVRAVDVSNPWSLVEVGSLDLGFAYPDIQVTGDRAFLGWTSGVHSSWSFSLPVVDVSEPTHPVLTGSVPTSYPVGDIVVVGDLALVGLGYDDGFFSVFYGVDIVDVSDPASPADVATLTMPDPIVCFAVDGTTVVLVDEGDRLQVVDISDPSAPVQTGDLQLTNAATGVSVAGNHVFLADSTGFRVLDISDPGAPTYVGSVVPPSYLPIRLMRVGDHVYGSFWFAAWEGWSGGFLVFDVSDPSEPVEVNTVGAGYPAGAVLVGDRLYVLGQWGFSGTDFEDLLEYEVSSSGQPDQLNYAPVGMGSGVGAGAMAVVGTRLLAAMPYGTIMVRVDRPWGVYTIDLGSADHSAMATSGHYLLAADWEVGLMILHDEEIFVDDFEWGDTSAW